MVVLSLPGGSIIACFCGPGVVGSVDEPVRFTISFSMQMSNGSSAAALDERHRILVGRDLGDVAGKECLWVRCL